MKTIHFMLLISVAAAPLRAQVSRELDAHVHGVSTLELVVDGDVLAANLTFPGVDIVGFEYEANSDRDKDVVEAAIRLLLAPENVLTLPYAAECRLAAVRAHFHGDYREQEAREDYGHLLHGHEENAQTDDRDHEEPAEAEVDGHNEGAVHSNFQAGYIFACDHPEELTAVTFPLFRNFRNAQKIKAQYFTRAATGAGVIERDDPKLSLN